jgi:IrrE N-terminal-like domain
MLTPRRYLSEAYIETRVSDTLRRFFAGGQAVRLPIRVERLAEDLFDLVVSWERVDTTEGALTLGGLRVSRHQLVLNELAREHFDRYPGSENFTKAHEIGHWVLHVRSAPANEPLFQPQAGEEIVCTSAAKKPQREVQADMFAAMLLMPRDLLLATCEGRAIDAWPELYELCRLLDVSISALRIRLETLGVLSVDAAGTITLGERGLRLRGAVS